MPVGGRGGIGVFNVAGSFYALRNRCPHKGGPLCQGRLRPHVVADAVYQVQQERGGEILKLCLAQLGSSTSRPGVALYDPAVRVKTYRVAVEQDQVVLYLD